MHGTASRPQPYTHGASLAGELAPAEDAETSALLDFRRFGLDRAQARFVNCGETPFHVLDAAFEAGAVQLVVNEGEQRTALLPQRVAKLVFYPPRPTAEGGVTGRGRVLVCSNYHWCADPAHWMGGKLFEGANLPLLHNFIAGAVAARSPRANERHDNE